MTQFLKRRDKGNGKLEKALAVGPETTDPAFHKKFPALAEFLSLEQWSPEEPRERGTLTLFFEDGQFKCCVSNRDSGEVAFVSKGTFQGLLESIEKGLVADSLDWRGQARKGTGKRGKG